MQLEQTIEGRYGNQSIKNIGVMNVSQEVQKLISRIHLHKPSSKDEVQMIGKNLGVDLSGLDAITILHLKGGHQSLEN